LFLMSMSLIQSSCTEFVETELPSSQMTGQAVFSDQATATAALINIYSGLRDQTLISGNSHGLGDLLGNYTDELDFYGLATATTYSFNTHSIISTDSEVANIWNRSYNLIYSSNSLLHGLDGNTSIGFKSRNKFKGEALFLRSFIHFYLAQLFGDIPYVTSIDYKVNAQIRNEGWTEVHEKLV